MTPALVVLVTAALAGPQEPAQAPVFPAKAELVRLDLVVRDKAGRLVDDLRADEVQVFEDGIHAPSGRSAWCRPTAPQSPGRSRPLVRRQLRLQAEPAATAW